MDRPRFRVGMFRRAAGSLAGLALVLAQVPALVPGAGLVEGASGACTADPVWFLGIVQDEERRYDFELDVANFEYFLATLRKTYCIPDSQANILAFENGYSRGGKSYPEATESNLYAEMQRMGADAEGHADATFFFFLSSHGLMWSGALTGACPVTRLAGSLAVLKPGGGEDGYLDDCELGQELGDSFSTNTRMLVAVDCSFCGGFSDSLTAASGSLPDGSVPTSSGVPAANRVVVTGCAITTECFGSDEGGTLFRHMKRVLSGTVPCDGWTAPGFPSVQGFDVPVQGSSWNPPDGRCTASEMFFGAVWSAYATVDLIGIQQQFRIKYGLPSVANDIVIL